MDSILCISAHPDDIEIGMGGTINRFINEKKIVNVVICFFHNEKRKNETYNALELLGLKKTNIYFLKKNIDNIRDMTKQLDILFKKLNPTSIFTHFKGDSHQEHKTVCDISISCSRNINCNIYMWENTFPGALTYNFFKPNFYIKLNKDDINNKINSFKEHKSQIKKYNSMKIYNFFRTKSEFWGFHCDSTNAEVFIQIKSTY